MEVSIFISGLLEYFKNLYVLSVDEKAQELIDLPVEDIEAMVALLVSYGQNDIGNILVLLQRLYLDARNSELSRELLEIAFIKLVRFREIVHPLTLVKRLEGLRAELVSTRESSTGVDQDIKGRESSSGGNPGPQGNHTTNPANNPNPRSSTDERVSREGKGDGEVSDSDIAEQVIRHFSRKRRALAEFLGRAKRFTLENNLLTICYGGNEKLSFEHVHESSAKRYIEKEIRDFLQKDIRLNVIIEGEKEKADEKETFSEDVTRVMKIFKGEIVPTGE
jgi:hypothetical protein